MNILILFSTLSVIAVAVAYTGVLNYRKSFRLRSDDVAMVIEKTRHVTGLHSQLELPITLKDTRLATCDPTVDAKVERHARITSNFDGYFARKVLNYLKNNIITYCETALELIVHTSDAAAYHGTTVDAVIGSIRFRGDHEFCVYSFLYGTEYGGRKVDLLFEIVFYLQTFYPEYRPSTIMVIVSVDMLKTQLQTYLKNLTGEDYNNLKIKFPLPDTVDLSTHVETLIGQLSSMRKTIAEFSKLFCLPTVPTIVGKDLHDSQVFRDYLRDDLVKSIFCVEEFIVVFEKINNEILTQSNRIVNTYIDPILDSPAEYQDHINRKSNAIAVTTIGMLSFLFTMDPSHENIHNTIFEVFTLFTLDSDLKINYYYLNVVQYYNIVSKVLLFVSIKHGKKLLGGIKNKLEKNCMNGQIISFDEIHMMKSTLFIFKLSLNHFVSTILENLHIDVTESYKIEFDEQVTEVLKFLENNISKNHQSDSCLQLICSKSNDTIQNIAAIKDNEIPSDTIFEKYCFFDPISTIYNINFFSRKYFKI